MREILFRGKKLSNGEWNEGDLLVNSQKKIGLILPNNGKECKIIDPETVGQFTGLTDKNGKKIFEGDIVRRFNGRGQEVMRYAVKWNTDCCMFGYRNHFSGKSLKMMIYTTYFNFSVHFIVLLLSNHIKPFFCLK